MAYWHKNHNNTLRTFSEDFEIDESIQSGFNSDVIEELRFGRFERALDRFNRIVEVELEKRT